ncbi:MAG: glycosyltransferase family 2 protein [Candidatus Firestonebacteria bacterium]|nr:glycosyltransferase family 2 protein [Candidatus Firestonebacteria bacterium]
MKKKLITITTAVYNEELMVREVYEVIKRTLAPFAARYNYEHIFMDNCSTDGTLAILKQIAAKDKRVKIITYSKNFGPVKTELMGYEYSSGDAVITFDANLKDPEDLIPTFIQKWEEGYEVVYGVRPQTQDNPLMFFMRRLFYRITAWLADEALPENVGGFRLLDRKVVAELLKIDDFKPYVRGLIVSIGYKQVGIVYARRARKRGVSKSHLSYLIDYAINAFISYSIMPIRICTYAGVSLAVLSFLLAVAYIVVKLFFWKFQAPGIASVVVLVCFFSGIQLFFLGIIGEYVGAIHSQVRKKPFVVVREKINL